MDECLNKECPYWKEGEDCPAELGCAGYESKHEITMEEKINEICNKLYKFVAEARDKRQEKVAIINIPVEYIELVINALELKRKHEKQWLDDLNNPLEPLKLSSALDSEIFKLEYRKANKPKEINILDYTVIYALKDCLERYSN